MYHIEMGDSVDSDDVSSSKSSDDGVITFQWEKANNSPKKLRVTAIGNSIRPMRNSVSSSIQSSWTSSATKKRENSTSERLTTVIRSNLLRSWTEVVLSTNNASL